MWPKDHWEDGRSLKEIERVKLLILGVSENHWDTSEEL